PYAKQSKEDRIPFYKKVFAFVFGPDEPHPTQEQKDRSAIRLIRARNGVLTTAELMQHTGLERPRAEEEMARLMSAYEGDVRVSEEGELLYVFPELMVSAHGAVRAREPDPAWRRLETPRAVTGNERDANLIIGGLNTFNLVAAATAPLFIFPRLGFSGTAAWIGLVWVPLVFSTMFFAVPAARMWAVARDNARRAVRNVRKVVMGFVYRASLVGDGAQPVRAPDLATRVAATIREGRTAPDRVEEALHELAAEFDAEVDTDAAGTLEFRFPEIRRQFAAAVRARRELALERQQVGDIVYSSADTAAEADERDRKAFDRKLRTGEPAPDVTAEEETVARPSPEAAGEEAIPAPSEVDLAGYIEAPDRVAYVEDWELVAFEEQMKRMRERELVRRR
ncbi:MAG TPA: hypothetical protein VE173_04005, partial [Longimicrobiales bacterium]|nr:hypothetical protein [Longimicrobiales bacterium]